MVDELADLLEDFPGESNKTRCFTHIINLVAKSIIKPFDVPKTQANEVLDDAAKEMAALAIDLDIEEQFSQESHSGEGDGKVSHGGDDDDSYEIY